MTVVAFCSDIHSNLEALEAFIAATHHCAARYCCGDVVGYGDRPNEVCEMLRRLRVPCVAGNHDWMVLGRIGGTQEREGIYRTQWTASVLSPDNREWLASLPERREATVGAQRVVLRHASPWDMTTYLVPASEQLARAMPIDGSTLVVGHSHRAFVHRGSLGGIVNCGSIGLPRSGAPGAHFAELSTGTGDWSLRVAPYDVRALQERLCSLGWDAGVIDRLGAPDRPASGRR